MFNKSIATLCAILGILPAFSQQIAINQVGFYTNGPKKAIVKTTEPGTFYLVQLPGGDTVYTGQLHGPLKNSYSPQTTYAADFSQFKRNGKYQLKTGKLTSPTIHISAKAHHDAAKAAMKSYYFQRLSMPLTETYAGKWKRPAGHPDTLVYIHPSVGGGGKISAPGGWYDAGDYNKYIVNSGITMGTLLSLYEAYPAYCKSVQLNIPESNNRWPDLLDECAYNLRWMLRMQDPTDGGVYHKLTNPSFDGFVMPDKATGPRYVVQKSTAAALDFAAVTAQAARVYAPFSRVLADSCRKAAIKAWRWALQHPKVFYQQEELNKQFEPKITTGEYGDRSVNDEWIWAAAELYKTTGDTQYQSYITNVPVQQWRLPAWAQVQVLAYYTLAQKAAIIAFADGFLSGSDSTTYQNAMGKKAGNFIWGSNSVAANQGIALLQAYRLTKDRRHLDGAIDIADYLLGRNATGYCYLTGFGSKQVMHLHHRPSDADGVAEPVPGFLAGGPNPGMQDKCPSYTSRVPDEAYTDDQCSYASNEVAINWNAPLVYLLWAIEASAKQAGL
ncbi:glycoside hydrolase family 9 protein [Chitinophaga horti]|uniref:Endoglucanase n=1 Tax=Chitinophaga horti TaxID=2920382 RepID=A0ABY6J0W5_9BACT|nr:glycoside hydrolase family 9 protein [Chitinophaga horti]UYQ91787.1 glycoside hydrolase family 9 protein [Chitinophaga horti]